MTDAELAILSLLAEGPSYDHDLNTAIDVRGLRRWTAIGYSSMYYVLEKLERQGLVEVISEEYGHRLFKISSAGVGVLQTAVADLISTPHSYEKSFELGLANLHVLRPSQVHTALLNRRQDIVMQIGKLRGERERAKAPFQVDALFDHNITMMEAELNWLDQFVEAWKAQAPAEPELVLEPSIIPRNKQVILPQDPDSIHKQVTNEVANEKRSTPLSMRTMPPKNARHDT